MSSSRYGLEIRAASSADAGGMAELLAGCGRAVPADVLAASLDAVRQGAGTALVALECGPPSGLVVVAWHPDLTTGRPAAWITALLVAEDARRKGIGRLLVKAASQAARVAGCDTVCVAVQGAGAELDAFCAATGFVAGARVFARGLRKQK